MDYLLNSSMEMLDEYYQPKDTDVVISLVSTEECEQRYHSLPYYHILARNMQNHNIRYCKAEMFKDCILGTLLIPDKRSIFQRGMDTDAVQWGMQPVRWCISVFTERGEDAGKTESIRKQGFTV